MTSKYGMAKDLIAQIKRCSGDNDLQPEDVQEATIIMLIQALKETRGADYVRGILQYEMDSLGSGGVYEIARGGGHS